ncbi:MAG TPA: ABC transporter permease [Candidatus Solibacter sp.]|nr:ABC transporter permease [Candidatus Solibacter sp.]
MARVRFAVRSLMKAPMLSLVVILSLGLGIGANTAIFSLLHQVVLASLPVQHPEELVALHSPGELKGGRSSTTMAGGMNSIFSYPMFRALEKEHPGVSAIAAFRTINANVSFGKQTNSGQVLLVSGGYFPMLRVRPLIGRTLTADDDQPGGGNAAAVLSYGYWQDRLGGNSVLNQAVRINGHAFTVVGIAPREFTGTTLGSEPDAYVPLSFKPQLTPNWDGTKRWDDYYLYIFARVPSRLSRAQATAALNGRYSGLIRQQGSAMRFRDDNRRQRFLNQSLTLADGSQGQSGFRSDNATPVWILMAATALVLLIAMANAANLLLARSAQRRRELAIRAAMGAGRGELMTQMLTEAMLLAGAGGVSGIAIGMITLKLLLSQFGGETPIYSLTSDLEWPVLAFSIALSLLTGLLFGLYPAWEAARSSLGVTLKDEAGQSSGTRGTARVRQALVCAQVTVSAVLLIPTGLFLKSLVNLTRVDLGIRAENLVTFSISPSLNGYSNEQSHALFERVEAELAAIPGVRGVAASMVPLMTGSNWGNNVTIQGRPSNDNDHSMYNEISPRYFGKMGIPLIAGREFTESDNLAGAKVAIVNEQFVKSFLQGRNPIGIRFSGGFGDTEIVGVVKDSHYSGVKQTPPNLYYLPWRQDKQIGSLGIYVRSALPAEQVVPTVRRAIANIDHDLPAENLRTMEEQVRLNIRTDRLILQLAAAFAVLATLLAMLGLYGVMAHSVTRRTREIGIRIALGAAPGRIRAMVMREMTWIVALGLITGIPAALVLTKYTESQLFGVKPRDEVVVAAATLALIVTSVLAALLPARRAVRVSPMQALRYE